MAAVKAFMNYLFQNALRPVDDPVAPQSPADSGYRDQFSRDRAFLQDTALKLLRKTTNFSMSIRRAVLLSADPTATRF